MGLGCDSEDVVNARTGICGNCGEEHDGYVTVLASELGRLIRVDEAVTEGRVPNELTHEQHMLVVRCKSAANHLAWVNSREEIGTSYRPSEFLIKSANEHVIQALEAVAAIFPTAPETPSKQQWLLLSQALGEILVAGKMIRADAELSGPELLMHAETFRDHLRTKVS